MAVAEAEVVEAFAENLDAECGLGLPGLTAEVDGTSVVVRWHGEVLARWADHDPEDPLDPADIGYELFAAMRSPRQDTVRVALSVVERELPAAQVAAREATGAEVLVTVEDRGDLGRARHWTTDAELDHGWPEVVVVVALGDEERAAEIAPEQHPHAIDVAQVVALAQELVAARSGAPPA